MPFSAYSVFAGGTLSYIAQSGIIGDYIDSLTRVRYFGPCTLYSGHGRISATPMEDIDHAIANAQKILAATENEGPEVFTRSRMSLNGKLVVRRRFR